MKKYLFGGLSIFTVAMFLLTQNVLAAVTATLIPNGQGFYVTWTGGDATVDGDTPLCNDYVLGTTTGDRESFSLDLSSIPDGSTITSVSVDVWDRQVPSTTSGSYKTFIRVNGTDTDAVGELSANGSGANCGTTQTQAIDVPDTVKSGATTLEIGVLKTDTDTDGV